MTLSRHQSTVIKNADEYISNQSNWKGLLDELRENQAYSQSQGQQVYIDRHIARGMMLARDRISFLLDPETPFLELQQFAGFNLPDEPPCANLITGIGRVHGRLCMVISHQPTINAGAWSECMVRKQLRVMEIATENSLPVIALVQSAGVFLP